MLALHSLAVPSANALVYVVPRTLAGDVSGTPAVIAELLTQSTLVLRNTTN